MTATETLTKARDIGTVVPGFNIPYLPMMAPTVQALRDTNSFGLIMVARLEWVKFEARSIEAIAEEYRRVGDPRHTRLHLDHVPVIDEDNLQVDFVGDISRALAAGYESVMVDGSRLSLAENIAATKQIVDLAHARGVMVEGELGAVMGHESGPLPPYEELFASGKGFTDPQEAARFVQETGVDWLSVSGRQHPRRDLMRDPEPEESRGAAEHWAPGKTASSHRRAVGIARRHRHPQGICHAGHSPWYCEDQHWHRDPAALRTLRQRICLQSPASSL